MKSSERRQKIEEFLRDSDAPLSATVLAEKLSVSRQIIVGDVALLRASGVDIAATPRGYVLSRESHTIRHSVVCNHGEERMEEELQLIVDYGCRVLDVTVEHPIYGELKGQLQISSRYEVSQFIEKLKNESAHSLSELTDGIHLHTLECPDEDAFEQLCNALRKAGFLCE